MKAQVNIDFPGLSPAGQAASNWQVEMMDWALPGGCQQAIISCQLKNLDPLDVLLLEKGLGKTLSIHQTNGELVWDGWVQRIRLSSDRLSFEWDLSHLHNRVLARYPSVSANLDPYQQWQYGSWVQEDQLFQEWGAKEQLLTLDYGNPASAQQAASQQLTREVAMTSSHLLKEGATPLMLEVFARGWWQRLDWTLDGEQGGLLSHISGGKNKLLFGQPDNQKLAQKFQTGSSSFPAGQICLRLAQMGSPADEVRVHIFSDQADAPGATLASTTLPSYQLQGGWQWHTWQLDAPLHLAANTPYWLVVERSGGLNLADTYLVESDEGLGYPQQVCKRWNGSTWTRINENLRYAVLAVSESSSLIREVANQAAAQGVLQGVQIWQESGVQVARWRAPEKTRKERLESWLQLGCLSGQRLSALVNAERILELFALPRMEGFPLYLTQAGRLTNPTDDSLPPPLDLIGRRLTLQIGLQAAEQVLTGLKWTVKDGLFPLLSEPK